MPDAANPPRSVMALDFSQRHIGVACGNTLTGTASPLTALKALRQQPDWAGLEQLIREWQPDLLLVGHPINMDGSASAVSNAALRFARQLQPRCRKPVLMMDERLSTHAARELAGEAGWHGDEPVDALAAQRILMTYLSEPERAHKPD